jgi:hypothetical protein
MADTTDFTRIATELQQQSFVAWKDAVEKNFEAGTQLLSLQKEYTLRAADILGTRFSKTA